MSPVDAMPLNDKGFADVFGNAWEWMVDYFSPLPGFQVHPIYEDFSTPCFDGLHNVIMGGSFISTGNEASIHSRFHFRPHFYQHASFRLVEQLNDEIITSDTDAPGPYVGNYPFRRSNAKMLETAKETDQAELAEFNSLLSCHFGQLHGVFSQLIGRNSGTFAAIANDLVHVAHNLCVPLASANALEVGCGPGGLTFQLAKHVHSIIGVDHNAKSVAFAKSMLNEEADGLSFTLRQEGDLVETYAIAKPTQLVAKQIEFRCADQMCLPAEMRGFDLVVLHDVLDKASAPNSVLGRLGGIRGLVRPGGMLVVLCQFNWTEDRTPKNLWLGGYRGSNGEIVHSEEELELRLRENFTLHQSTKAPLLWHETEGKIGGKTYSVLIFRRAV
jgi:SAM-dependent methyltransferase